MKKSFYVYMLASQPKGTIYIGFTSNLIKRVWEHKQKLIKGFTKQYNVDKLVYYEMYEDPVIAISREKRLKKYLRQWKIDLIESMNPDWDDLYDSITS